MPTTDSSIRKKRQIRLHAFQLKHGVIQFGITLTPIPLSKRDAKISSSSRLSTLLRHLEGSDYGKEW